MAYIIGAYNHWDKWDQEHSKYVFCVNENWYAVKEVELEWGYPVLPYRIELDNEVERQWYQIYDTEQDAMEFARQIKQLNAR